MNSLLRGLSCSAVIGLTCAGFSQWMGFGGDSRHSAQWSMRSRALDSIVWHTPVDMYPPYSGSSLLAHYGSPMITLANTVVIPVKTGQGNGFKVQGRRGTDGTVIWTAASTYTVPPYGWFPSFGPTLLPPAAVGGPYRVAWPESGGRVSVRASADASSADRVVYTFYGKTNYQKDPGNCDANIKICTPLTAGPDGSIYFGFIALADTVGHVQSGLAKIDPTGKGSYIPATTLSGDPDVGLMKQNAAPAVSRDGKSIYVAVYTGGYGRGDLVEVNGTTFTPANRIALKDPHSGNDALVDSDGTASPLIGPDGTVFFGVLENGLGSNHYRGFNLHFSTHLKQEYAPAAFGWDNTPSIVPARIVPFYTGTSTYLLFAKYNNYAGAGGDGVNKIALLDPNDTMTDPISGITVMKEIATQISPTADEGAINNGYTNAVKEWCVNSAAVDIPGKCVLANCEDGVLYRWDFVTNTLSESMRLTSGLGEAYTSTLIGPDGKVYAINNATLFAVGSHAR